MVDYNTSYREGAWWYTGSAVAAWKKHCFLKRKKYKEAGMRHEGIRENNRAKLMLLAEKVDKTPTLQLSNTNQQHSFKN